MQALEYACLPVFEKLSSVAKESEPNREQVLTELKDRLSLMQARARKLGCSDTDIEDATYALVALIDERIPRDNAQLREEWRNALQQLCYNENTAGEGFFYRLDTILRAPRRQEAARIYGLCLAFGFRGVYQNNPELAALRVGVRRYQGLPSKTLPMNPALPPDNARRRGSRRNFAIIWSAAAVLSAGIIGTALVRNKLNKETKRIIQGLSVLPSVKVTPRK